MNIPDDEDPDFKAEINVLRAQLFAACCFVLGFLCLVVSYLTR